LWLFLKIFFFFCFMWFFRTLNIRNVRCESIVRISSKAPERFNHASNGQTANITNVDVDCRTRDTETGGFDKKSKDPRGSHFMYTKKRKKRKRERLHTRTSHRVVENRRDDSYKNKVLHSSHWYIDRYWEKWKNWFVLKFFSSNSMWVPNCSTFARGSDG